MKRRKAIRNGNNKTANKIGKTIMPDRQAHRKHPTLVGANSNGGTRIQATEWRTVATKTVMINRFMATQPNKYCAARRRLMRTDLRISLKGFSINIATYRGRFSKFWPDVANCFGVRR